MKRLVVLLLLVFARAAAAQAPMAEARRHFDVGLELIDRHAWDGALAEFLRSVELHPTASALENAAVCRRELGRYDEALDTYDALLAKMGTQLSPDERRAVEADMARLERFTGHLAVTSDPPGATVFVDDRPRGTTPLASPLRLTVGTRAVRVDRPGYAPFETKVLVTHGDTQRVLAKLPVIARLGTLRVRATNGPDDVIVDGTVVGRTPWEGTLAAASHTVALRSADGALGTDPRTVDIATGQVTSLELTASRLSGVLRVEPTPSDASVAIDGKKVPRGSWGGAVLVGKHDVRVAADWYEPEQQTVTVVATGVQAVRPTLARVPRADVEVSAGPTPFYDSGVRGGIGACNAACFGYTVGLRAAYRLTPRLAVELGVSIVALPHESTTTVSGTFEHAAVQGSYTETADTFGYAFGPSLRYQIGDAWPLSLRLTVGAAALTFTNVSSGQFQAPDGSSYGLGNRDADTTFWSPVLAPEIRFGHRFARTIVVDVGASLFLYVTPSIAPEQAVNLNPIAVPPRPALQGGVMFAVPLTVAIRVEL